MTLEQLKKKSKEELAEMYLAQEKELGILTEELAAANRKLRDRTLKIENCGSIAEASLLLTNIFNEAQTAADQYLENVQRVQQQTEAFCRNSAAEAAETAEQTIRNAQQKADEILHAAAQEAEKTLNRAAAEASVKLTEAERMLGEARSESETIRTEALKFFVGRSNEHFGE